LAAHTVTQLLLKWSRDEEGLDQLIPLVQDEPHRIARRHMKRERTGHTLQTTALMNEAYLRLINQPQVTWRDRVHFFGIAARMRQILVDQRVTPEASNGQMPRNPLSQPTLSADNSIQRTFATTSGIWS
jgi:hypothetical protein